MPKSKNKRKSGSGKKGTAWNKRVKKGSFEAQVQRVKDLNDNFMKYLDEVYG